LRIRKREPGDTGADDWPGERPVILAFQVYAARAAEELAAKLKEAL